MENWVVEKFPCLRIPLQMTFMMIPAQVVKTSVTPKTIYNWMSKVKQDCFVFALHWPVTGPENMYLPFNQSNAKLKPNRTYPHLAHKSIFLSSDWALR